MQEWMIASVIVFSAATLQALTGFGFAILATPLLLLLYDSRDSIQMSILLSFMIAIILMPRIRQEVDYGMFRRFVAGSIPGIPLGLVFFSCIGLDALKIMVSVVILIVTSMSLINLYKHRDCQYSPAPLAETVMPSSGWELLVGFFAGVLTTSIGMPGVPLVLYFIAVNAPKGIIRSTTLAFFICVYIFSILAQVVTGKMGTDVLIASLILTPANIMGVIAGYLVFPKITQSLFQLITNLVLVFTAVCLFIKAF